MAEYIDKKFIVINIKHLNRVPQFYAGLILWALDLLARWIPKNKYYVCNQDEPYAKEVIDVIIKGETDKEGK